jgi:hypothetical protein
MVYVGIGLAVLWLAWPLTMRFVQAMREVEAVCLQPGAWCPGHALPLSWYPWMFLVLILGAGWWLLAVSWKDWQHRRTVK